MSKPRRKERSPKRILALPDLEQSKTAVLNSLVSKSGQRTYDRAITGSGPLHSPLGESPGRCRPRARPELPVLERASIHHRHPQRHVAVSSNDMGRKPHLCVDVRFPALRWSHRFLQSVGAANSRIPATVPPSVYRATANGKRAAFRSMSRARRRITQGDSAGEWDAARCVWRTTSRISSSVRTRLDCLAASKTACTTFGSLWSPRLLR